jgi:hypothetical protein
MPRLSHSISQALRQFSYWLANRTVGLPLLEGVDYSCIFEEASALEQTYVELTRFGGQRRYAATAAACWAS